ncbi:WD40-repeat-containing domain protein [Boletus coccyginus]|nr:WD40-repeat-containing domain protein [Boletus coccyginus]
MLMKTQESSEIGSSSSTIHQEEAKPIVIDGRDYIYSVAVLVDGKHVVSGGEEGKIRRWRIEDGGEVGTPMDAGSAVFNIAVTRDGKRIVSVTRACSVMVWNAGTRSKATEFKAHGEWVRAVDISPDSTKIATGSDDFTACVWSLSTGEKLLRLKHDNYVVATKFSPDGRLFATATFIHNSVRVYDSRNGSLLVDFPVTVNSAGNQSLVWASDSKQLFVLSHDGYIHHIDVSAKTTLSKWLIHGTNNPACIALASNGTFIAASENSSVSLWDTTTHEQIGAVIEYTHTICSMAISSNYDLVTSGDKKITFRALCDTLPSHCTPRMQEIQHAAAAKVDDSPNESTANLKQAIQELRNQLTESQRQARHERDNLIQSLRAQEKSSSGKIALLEKTTRELRDKLAESQRAANQVKDDLNDTINSLRTDLRTSGNSSSALRIQLADAQHRADGIKELRDKLAESQRAANQEKDDLNETINSLRTDLRTRDNSSSVLRIQLADAQRKADGINHALEQMYQYESLYAHGRIQGAAECLLEFANIVHEDVRANKFIIDWLTESTNRCITALETIGDEASNTDKWDDAVAAYSTALSLGPTVPNAITCKWANMILKRNSAYEASSAANKFKVPRFCDILERDGRLTEAVECFQQMQNELPEHAGVRDESVEWELDFKARCMKALEKNGDVAMDSASYEDAVTHYSTALFLDPLSAVLLTKQSKARDGSLQDANAAIKRHRQSKMERWAVVVLLFPCPVSHRLSSSCIIFPLKGPLVPSGDPPQRVYHTTTSAFGTVEIKTTEDLSRLDKLVLVHPWLRCLLDPALPSQDDAEPSPVDSDGDSEIPFTNPRPAPSYTAASSRHAQRLDKLTRALRLLARLRQPFGALLLAPSSLDEYKHVASDHPIVVQLLKGISLRYLAQMIRTLDIL